VGKGGGDDYLNVPLSRSEYEAFVGELVRGEKVPFHDFEKAVYFEGCLPIEAMAERGVETLRHGPLKPFGLMDPGPGKSLTPPSSSGRTTSRRSTGTSSASRRS